MRNVYQSPNQHDDVVYPGESFIQQLLENSHIDQRGLYPTLYTLEQGVRCHLAVPTALSCLGPKVAGLLVYNTHTGHFEPVSIVMDQRITHVASRNKALGAMNVTGNIVTRQLVMALTQDAGEGVRRMGETEVLYSGFGGFHVRPDPDGHPLHGDILLMLENETLLRFRIGAPGESDSVLFRQRTYLVQAGSFFDNMEDVRVNFHDPSSPLHAMAWSVLPHVAIAAHRREHSGHSFHS